MTPVTLMMQYLGWRFSARGLHGVHSPFLYRFMKECIYRRSDRSEFDGIEKIRDKLLRNKAIIEYPDLGAGSRLDTSHMSYPGKIRQRSVSDIAKYSLQRKKYCRLFFRIVQHLNSESILELGASLGITTSYLAKANPNASIHTIEGAEAIAKIAIEVFKEAGLNNIYLDVGNFDDILPAIPADKKYDLILLDGNHRGDATMNYFQWVIKHIQNDGVLIVDDIRWSESMYSAWKKITQHEAATLTLDLFTLGLVFFNKRFSKENFKIRY
jgi:predicted O-methyltransferase YrrM